jgi:CheY-like chemotaxis protein
LYYESPEPEEKFERKEPIMNAIATEKKVLLIDDEASLRRSVSMGLMQQGYQTEPCENGMKALQTLEMFKRKNIPLDYAIVDIKLPDIDGLKLLKVIKFNYPNLPVIMITGYGNEATLEEATTQHADAYLEKPFSMDDLTKVLSGINVAVEESIAPESTPAESAVPSQSVSAYALLSIDSSANLLKVYRKLYFLENVLYCDAIRGDYDIVLLLQAPTFDKIQAVLDKEVKTIEGVADVTLLNV